MNRLLRLSFALVGAAMTLGIAAEAFAGETVTVNMNNDEDGTMMGLFASPSTVKAGKVTFSVINNSGNLEHEAVVLMLSKDQAMNPLSLPYDENVERVPEDKIEASGEVAELEPGKSGSVTLDLKPGIYEIFCNVPGHFKAGMHDTITVK